MEESINYIKKGGDNLRLRNICCKTAVYFLMISAISFCSAVTHEAHAATITVNDFTSTAVQTAINSASAGDIIYLPGGTYNFTGTVTVNKAVTIKGAAELHNLCVVEYGPYITSNVPPNWNGTPSDCYANTDAIRLFSVTNSDGVIFENLKIRGRTTSSTGSNHDIYVNGYNKVTIKGCELAYSERAVYLISSFNNLIKGNYIHHNNIGGLGYGVSITGPTMLTGGSQATIRNNEFTANRHDVATNSPQTSFIIYKNYTHDDEDVEHQPCFESHVQGLKTLRGVVRDNIFVRTRPLAYKSGSLEISGNYFDSTCGNSDWANGGFGYSNMIIFGTPEHNGAYVEGAELHNIYFGSNINNSGRTEVVVSNYLYNGVRKLVTYNLYHNGKLWEATYTTYPPLKTDPRPLLGEVYVTQAGTSTRIDKIIKNTWYDLHAMACDPQGADNIARIGIQLRDPNAYSLIPVNTTGEFRPAGNYFIETDGDSVYVRKTEGSSDWTAVADSTQDLYVDTNIFQYFTDGSHRKHFVIRFKVLDNAIPVEWIINGYAMDAEGNLPHSQAYNTQEGWYLTVGDGSLGSLGVTEEFAPGLFKIASVYPNPFNPSTTIALGLPRDGHVIISIYNVNGQKVRELANSNMFAGKHSFIWDGRDSSGQVISAGVYFTRAEMGGSVATKKMLFLK
ncbi:MAG: FlgD immunoglobulin-like domain containing protein [Candidatus Latescibacter sp.]|nr:FlgD immunoglobulin-like domain containing protein [Candidatus Latescibacter sp.]